jgi:hypothetical protein
MRPLERLQAFRFSKVHPAEISKEILETLGFRPAGGHLIYAATLRQRSVSPEHRRRARARSE